MVVAQRVISSTANTQDLCSIFNLLATYRHSYPSLRLRATLTCHDYTGVQSLGKLWQVFMVSQRLVHRFTSS